MSKKIILRFTLKELSGLIQDEKSRVILQRCIRKIPLQPYCLNDLRGSIHEELDANLAKFDHELKGLLLSHKNVKIVKNVANMLHDDPRLYVTIQADFYLFMPEVGRVLRGIVNKKSADHIGCLVHKAFNVSIPRPVCETIGDWKGYYVEIGQEVTFRVESLDLTGSLPYMVGCLLELGSVPSPASLKFSEENLSDSLLNGENKIKPNGAQELQNDPQESLCVVDKKKKKKHKKNAGLESIPDLSLTEYRNINSILEAEKKPRDNEMCEENDVDNNVLKAMKKKKKKRKYAEHDETLKQEEEVYNRGDEWQTINNPDSYAGQVNEYEEQLSEDKQHNDDTLTITNLNNISIGAADKKKKRKYSEVFQDHLDYKEPISVSQDESWKSSKSKKKRKKLMSEVSYTYEDAHSINTTQEITEVKVENSENGKVVKEEFFNEAEQQNIHTSQNISPKKKKKKKEKFGEETEYAQPDNGSIETLEEVTKRKKKKEKLLAKMSNVEMENHSIDTSQEVSQEKKKKKKRKKNNSDGNGDETMFGETDSPTNSVLHITMPYNKHLTHIQDINNVSDKMESKTSLDTEYCKKLGKKSKSYRVSDIATSTPVGYRCSQDYKSSFNLLDKSDMTQLHLSPVETKDVKNEKLVESDSPSFKVESLKKENVSHLKIENSSGTPVNSLQRRGNIYKKYQVENSSQHEIENDLEHIQKKNPKLAKRESAVLMPKKGNKAHTKPVQGNINFNTDVSDSQDDSSDSDNRLKNVFTESVKSKTEVSRIPYNVAEMERCKVEDDMNIVEDNSGAKRSSPEKSSEQNENKYGQTWQNLYRACSSDSGLSLSVTSGDRDCGSSAVCKKKREVSSPYTRHNSDDSLKDGKPVKISKTSKRKRTLSPDRHLGHYSAKKVKKEEESTMPSNSHQSNIKHSSGDDSLESERMKLLSAMVKRLDDVNEKESSVKNEHSTHREGLVCTNEHPSPHSKNKGKRKRKSIDSTMKNTERVQALDTAGFCREGASMQTIKPVVSSPLSNKVTVMGTAAKIQSNLRCEEEQSPIRSQSKNSQKAAKKKKHSGVENNKIKSPSNKEIKIKVEKESPKKSETMPSNNTGHTKSLEGETPDVIADRLLQEFIKKRSIC